MAFLKSPQGHQIVLYALTVAALGVMTGQFARSQVPSQVEDLTPTCSERLNVMFAKYTAPTTWTDGCDPACLMECNEVLQDSIYSSTSRDCPPQAEITACFNIYSNEWEAYVNDCELFKIEANSEAETEGGESEASGTAEAEAEGAAEAEGEASSEAGAAPEAAPSSLSDLSGGEGKGEASAEAEGEGEGAAETTAPSLTNKPLPTTEPLSNSASEAEASPSSNAASEGEGEGEATPPSPKPKPVPSTSSSSSEGEGEAGRRRLLSEGEGESEGSEASGAGLGCFPKFKTMEEFRVYANGTYFDTYYSAPSDVAGILMSTAFWISLAGVGFLVRS